ncbi:Coiled-coil-helix-coiled-coil-helix domain-containing protein 1 [Operophtera brumata]|uniref:Coiled-coil-helix-coiled-coil-helix domain-containing protein 1 n=1 Tax=Operophtera brumata TaxID=104452 RepID=A0A0L7KL21_OPEBR|nr:Coiled-coil-helix-coiled-coil-helix domain-containing protein 1 [Operophtera brumata]
MRVNPILFKNARRPQKEPVPFQMLLPLELKKTVSGKGDKSNEAACMQEMAVMFACFKKADFEQQECMKEISAFQGCYKDYAKKMSTQREQGRKGILVPGEKNLTHKQMNQLLKNFPPMK